LIDTFEGKGAGIPREVRRNLVYIAGAQALVGAGGQLTPSLGAIIALRLSGSSAFVGVATSLTGLSRMVVSYPIGSISDRYGRKAGLVVGLAVAMLGAVLTGLSVVGASFLLFIGGMFVFGCGIMLCSSCASPLPTCSHLHDVPKVSASC
jgi:MFS family permease